MHTYAKLMLVYTISKMKSMSSPSSDYNEGENGVSFWHNFMFIYNNSSKYKHLCKSKVLHGKILDKNLKLQSYCVLRWKRSSNSSFLVPRLFGWLSLFFPLLAQQLWRIYASNARCCRVELDSLNIPSFAHSLTHSARV